MGGVILREALEVSKGSHHSLLALPLCLMAVDQDVSSQLLLFYYHGLQSSGTI